MTTKKQDKRQPKRLINFERDTSRRHKLHKPDRVIVRELLYKSKSSAKVESKKE